MKKVIAILIISAAFFAGCGKSKLPDEIVSGARSVLEEVSKMQKTRISEDELYDRIAPIMDRLNTYEGNKSAADLLHDLQALYSNVTMLSKDNSDEISRERITDLADQIKEKINS